MSGQFVPLLYRLVTVVKVGQDDHVDVGVFIRRRIGLIGKQPSASSEVRGRRVAIKSLPGRPLLLGDTPFTLPPGVNLDVDRQWVVEHCRHDAVLLVENWENFELTEQTPILKSVPGNPLVVFRGAPGSYKIDSAHRLLKDLGLPVIAFTDYDPEGLAIAATLPFFSQYLAPGTQCLEKLCSRLSTQRRYREQIVQKRSMLEALDDPELKRVFEIIKTAGKALPQESLIGLSNWQE
ncbi:hypothetical protein [Pseudomonas sp. 10S4]|uniref:DUF7281 domain-containing protein n=1 Tax=Pseudomonas sp. 10S4 TaxID=3048583 RepID=UPI002AC8B1F2|nr:MULTISPECIES: hypothetical protein [unclassified Pseudomonas]MEB0222880.1 hypothetical protein [Pseudomonas sp. 5S1]MEB0293075.1 hypothetical protein [Pseudomonas sp. 10S4]WPX17182.1 hypothetical protein RHM58_25170 [Pseudomonas sp. 10S4]